MDAVFCHEKLGVIRKNAYNGDNHRHNGYRVNNKPCLLTLNRNHIRRKYEPSCKKQAACNKTDSPEKPHQPLVDGNSHKPVAQAVYNKAYAAGQIIVTQLRFCAVF